MLELIVSRIIIVDIIIGIVIWKDSPVRQGELHWHAIKPPDGDFVSSFRRSTQLVTDVSKRVLGEEWLALVESRFDVSLDLLDGFFGFFSSEDLVSLTGASAVVRWVEDVNFELLGWNGRKDDGK